MTLLRIEPGRVRVSYGGIAIESDARGTRASADTDLYSERPVWLPESVDLWDLGLPDTTRMAPGLIEWGQRCTICAASAIADTMTELREPGGSIRDRWVACWSSTYPRQLEVAHAAIALEHGTGMRAIPRQLRSPGYSRSLSRLVDAMWRVPPAVVIAARILIGV